MKHLKYIFFTIALSISTTMVAENLISKKLKEAKQLVIERNEKYAKQILKEIIINTEDLNIKREAMYWYLLLSYTGTPQDITNAYICITQQNALDIPVEDGKMHKIALKIAYIMKDLQLAEKLSLEILKSSPQDKEVNNILTATYFLLNKKQKYEEQKQNPYVSLKDVEKLISLFRKEEPKTQETPKKEYDERYIEYDYDTLIKEINTMLEIISNREIEIEKRSNAMMRLLKLLEIKEKLLELKEKELKEIM